jgi:hypothetical protein
MGRCDWCGLHAVLYNTELLMRGVRYYVKHFRLCQRCLTQAED